MGRFVCRRRCADAVHQGPDRPAGRTQATASLSVITPRRTRLVRVPDLNDFRRAIDWLCGVPSEISPGSDQFPSRIVIVPTRGAAEALAQTLGMESRPGSSAGVRRPAGGTALLTRDELYDALHARLPDPPRRLSAFERDAMAQAAASGAANDAADLPFRIRPGLVTEILRFYDQLRRQSQTAKRF